MPLVNTQEVPSAEELRLKADRERSQYWKRWVRGTARTFGDLGFMLLLIDLVC